jgi:hypothetical protein
MAKGRVSERLPALLLTRTRSDGLFDWVVEDVGNARTQGRLRHIEAP